MQGADVLRPMPEDDLIYTGHYIDHELVSNIEADCETRRARKREKKPMRFLLTIGGAGAQREIFASIIKHLLPAIRDGQSRTVCEWSVITAMSGRSCSARSRE